MSYKFDNLGFYTRTADSVHISSISIEYMNGKKITLTSAKLEANGSLYVNNSK